MYTEEPSISMYNPAFVAKVHAKRRDYENSPEAKEARRLAEEARRKAELEAHTAKLAAMSEKARAEREKLARARKAANDAIRAAHAAVQAMHLEMGLAQRPRVERARSMASVLATVSRFTGISQAEIAGPHRNVDIAFARQAVMYWCARRTNRSYPEIGRFLNRDHTSVLHGVDAYVEKRAKSGRKLRRIR